MSGGGWCSQVRDGVRIAVHIVPNAKKTEVIGLHGDALKLRLQAQPIEGKANEALIRYIADRLDAPKSAVVITHGHTAKRKLLEVGGSGMQVSQVMRTLLPEMEE